MQLPVNGGWVFGAAVSDVGLGAAASVLTCRPLGEEREIAAWWWLSGGGVTAMLLAWRIAAALGALTGWAGWPQVAGALVVACVVALLLVLVPGVHRRNERGHSTVPFGPCLFGGTLVVILAGG